MRVQNVIGLAILVTATVGGEELVNSHAILESLTSVPTVERTINGRSLGYELPTEDVPDNPAQEAGPRASIPLIFNLNSQEITSRNVTQLREIAIALEQLGLKSAIAPQSGSRELEMELPVTNSTISNEGNQESTLQSPDQSSGVEVELPVQIESTSKEKEQVHSIESPPKKVIIEGYTCDLGDPDDNIKLSERRAISVKAFLVGAGFDPDLIEVKGYGEEFPVAENTTEENRMKNRRVEIVLSHADPEIKN